MLERYETNFAALSPEQTQYLAAAMQRRNPEFIANEAGEYESGTELMHHADAYGFDQADVVMSLAQDATPMGTAIIETIIQPHRITRPAAGATTAKPTTPRKPRTPRPPQQDPRVILSVAPNPKRKGSASAARYDLYQVGDTVAEAISKGLTRGDISHDTAKGFITLK